LGVKDIFFVSFLVACVCNFVRYENATNPPLIFASPFRRTMHTALYVANALNLKIQIEDGLVEKRHGLWNRTKMTDCFSKHLKYFNTQ
jgi:broad specificity phosphatase PhoE